MKKDTIQFNLEMLFSEVGVFVGAQLFAHLAAIISVDPDFISLFGVIGATAGSAIFWVIMRIRDGRTRGEYSRHNLFDDILHYSPAATTLGLFVCQPIFFIISTRLMSHGMGTLLAVLIGQFVGFIVFAVLLNIYRHYLEKVTGKRL